VFVRVCVFVCVCSVTLVCLVYCVIVVLRVSVDVCVGVQTHVEEMHAGRVTVREQTPVRERHAQAQSYTHINVPR